MRTMNALRAVILGLPLLVACTVNSTTAQEEPQAPAATPATTAPAEATPPATTGVPAPTEPAATTAPPRLSPIGAPVVVGGFTAADPTDAKIQAEAAEAVTLLQQKSLDRTLALDKVRAAATQVVAGTNYRLELDVRSSGAVKPVTVVMYKDLQGARSLTSVEGM